jgi:hypothetical protein
LACGPEFSVEFSAPPEFSGGVTENYLSTGWGRTFDLQIRKQIFYHCAGIFWLYLQLLAAGSYLPGFSGRICSYWQRNFPAISVVTFWDFLALPFLAPEGRDFPALSVVSGRDFPAIAFLAWVI